MVFIVVWISPKHVLRLSKYKYNDDGYFLNEEFARICFLKVAIFLSLIVSKGYTTVLCGEIIDRIKRGNSNSTK